MLIAFYIYNLIEEKKKEVKLCPHILQQRHCLILWEQSGQIWKEVLAHRAFPLITYCAQQPFMYVKYCSVGSLVTVQLDTIFPWAVSMACTLLGREWVTVIFTLVLTTHCISWSCSLYSSKVFGGWKVLVANFHGWCLCLYYLLKIYNTVTCLIGKAK